MDIDDFKAINDRQGHLVGDELLIQVGMRLMAITRPTDVVARIGGDEFLVMAAGERTSLEAFAERIKTDLCRTYELDGEPTAVTVSLGISAGYEEAPDARSLMKSADSAMYGVKKDRAVRRSLIAALPLAT